MPSSVHPEPGTPTLRPAAGRANLVTRIPPRPPPDLPSLFILHPSSFTLHPSPAMLLLENCRHLATFDDQERELRHVDVLIDGPVVRAIGPNLRAALSLPEDTPFIDASHHLVIPGLVNVHHHMWQVLTRVMPRVQDHGLFTWLVENYKVWEALDPNAERAAATLAMSELLLSG